MLLRNRVKIVEKSVEKLKQSLVEDFDRVSMDVDYLVNRLDTWARLHKNLVQELSTNGVIRDLRKLQKENKELREELDQLTLNAETTADNLDNYIQGTSKEIKDINQELFKDTKKKDAPYEPFILSHYWHSKEAKQVSQEPTLAGKVDAIIKHLGLEVAAETEKVTEARSVAKKVTKKKASKK